MKKLLYLFLALLLPALVFVFLKYAGRNEFNIPVYFEKGVTNPPADCVPAYASPYLLHDSIWHITGTNRMKANVLVFQKPGLDIGKLKLRIEEEFGLKDVLFQEACAAGLDSATCKRLKKCVYLVKDPWETVLIDQQGRIRGYYDLLLREDEDRLRVELKILIKKY